MMEEEECGLGKSCARSEPVAAAQPAGSPGETPAVTAESPELANHSSKCVFCRIAAHQDPGTELLHCEVGCDARPGAGGIRNALGGLRLGRLSLGGPRRRGSGGDGPA